MKRIQVYDCKKYDDSGDGRVTIEIITKDRDPKDIKNEIKTIRERFKNQNIAFRQKNKPKSKRVTKVLNDKQTHLNTQLPKIINKIDLELDDNTGNTTVILASSKSGKSTLLMHLYNKYYNDKDFITTLFSISCHIPIYKDKKKRLIKICRFDKDGIQLIKSLRLMNHKCKNKYDFCCIFDDIIDVRYSNVINNLILTYRNSNISSIISLQYANLLSKASRGSVNNIILGRFNSDGAISSIINCYLKSRFSKDFGISNEIDQINLYKQLTKDHQFIYLHPESGAFKLFKIKI